MNTLTTYIGVKNKIAMAYAGLFTKEEVERFAMQVGQYEWDETENTIRTALTAIATTSRKEKIIQLMDEVDELENRITELLKKGFINDVEGVNLGYINAANQLLTEASRKLNYMARLANISVFYDRFKQIGENSSKHSIQSFY